MTTVHLKDSTGSIRADQAVQQLTFRIEAVLPGRIAAIYVEGSYADGTAMATSDLDLVVVFRDSFAAGEKEVAENLLVTCSQEYALELDVELVDETHLAQAASPMFKLGSRLLYGEDVRGSIPLVPIEEWARQRMHAAYWLTINVFHRPKPVRFPLSFPHAEARFYGYTERTMELPDGAEVPTTRNLIRVTGWIATARVAHEAGEFVVRKRDCVPSYRRTIGDKWTELLAQIDRRCRADWQYRIPPGPAEQDELRAILDRTLAYENDFLLRYRRFLLGELTEGHLAAQRDALRFLENTFYADPAIARAVQALSTSEHQEVRMAVQRLESHLAPAEEGRTFERGRQ